MATTNISAAPQSRTRWAWLIGTFFGAGFMKPGPGTWGSAGGVLLWFLAAHFVPVFVLPITVLLALAATLIGIPAGTIVARESGRKDPGHVVIDEVAGQLVALIGIPIDWKYALAGFILFRGFDILKPPPARQMEKLPGGTGIMLDDIAAGLYALLVLLIVRHFHWL
jgi:phosphatidylglycerophosphatase A